MMNGIAAAGTVKQQQKSRKKIKTSKQTQKKNGRITELLVIMVSFLSFQSESAVLYSANVLVYIRA